MSAMIGHARGGDPTDTPGDQSGGEVRTQGWYSYPWQLVLRAKDPNLREKMARACEAVCANDNIGYSQTRRNDLHAAWLKAGRVIKQIEKPADCDCSSLMAFCAEAAGVDMAGAYTGGNAPWTGNMRTKFLQTGAFEVLTDAKYLASPDYLLRGDVLVNEASHTAMALSDGEKSRESAPVVVADSVEAVPREQETAEHSVAPPLKSESGFGFGRTDSGTQEHFPFADNASRGACLDASVGDVVAFIGSTHYTAADSDRGYTARPGPAKVTAISEGTKHPYHLVHTDSTSNVFGWVNAADIETQMEREHVIVWGDTLWDLARRYGTTIPAICAANNITTATVLLPGRVLKIP